MRRHRNALGWDAFRRRVAEICLEAQVWSPFSASSLAVVGGRASGSGGDHGKPLVSLVYSCRGSGGGQNPLVLSPTLAVCLSVEGDLISLEGLRTETGKPASLGRRWGELASRMTRDEREAFRATYHELLVRESGPAAVPLPDVAPEYWKDLGTLFRAVAEPPLVPYLAQQGEEYFRYLGAAS
jgi:hypothetical protein